MVKTACSYRVRCGFCHFALVKRVWQMGIKMLNWVAIIITIAILGATAFFLAQPMWWGPLYVRIHEILVISLIGASGIIAGLAIIWSRRHRGKRAWMSLTVATLFTGLSIISFFSVGLILLPMALVLLALSLINLKTRIDI